MKDACEEFAFCTFDPKLLICATNITWTETVSCTTMQEPTLNYIPHSLWFEFETSPHYVRHVGCLIWNWIVWDAVTTSSHISTARLAWADKKKQKFRHWIMIIIDNTASLHLCEAKVQLNLSMSAASSIAGLKGSWDRNTTSIPSHLSLSHL